MSNSIFETKKRKPSGTVLHFCAFPFAFLLSEIACKLSIYGLQFDKSWFFVIIFALSGGLLFGGISALFSPKVSRIINIVALSALFVYYGFSLIYYKFFQNFFLWQTLGMAGNLTDFVLESVLATLAQWYMVLILALPLTLYCIFGGTHSLEYKNFGIFAIILFVVLNGVGMLFTLTDGNYKSAYFGSYSVDNCVHNFGFAKNSVLEWKYIVFRPSDDVEIPTDEPKEDEPQEIVYADNVMDIDFDTLIANSDSEELTKMHEYFKSRTPTKQNEYTGRYKGYNLIFLTLEGFTDKCIDPVLTPTLYKMATQGYVFENFYNSLWGGSTASGEYAVTSGNFYTAATALKLAGDNYWPFALGNQFKNLGYITKSYHNHTYKYYGRDVAHAAFGYEYKALGNGLEGVKKVWPESDLEMAISTGPEFIGTEPFHVYYMTVSGHCDYSFNDNMMCYKNRELVANMDASDEVRAYYACQIELDRCLENLCQQLAEAGVLEHTVFAMASDHYPYGLSDDALAELYNLPKENIRNNFDLYRNGFILWSGDMTEPITVTKPCSAIDIIPTLSNLFGLEYDSRLLMGSDILSTADSPVILNSIGTIGSNHWITAKGCYNAYKKEFTPYVEMTPEEQEEYVSKMNSTVQAKEKYSLKIMDKDYYRIVFGQ